METSYLRKIFEKFKEFWKLIFKNHIFFHNIKEIKNWKLLITKILRIFIRKYKKNNLGIKWAKPHICMLKNKNERSYIYPQ